MTLGALIQHVIKVALLTEEPVLLEHHIVHLDLLRAGAAGEAGLVPGQHHAGGGSHLHTVFPLDLDPALRASGEVLREVTVGAEEAVCVLLLAVLLVVVLLSHQASITAGATEAAVVPALLTVQNQVLDMDGQSTGITSLCHVLLVLCFILLVVHVLLDTLLADQPLLLRQEELPLLVRQAQSALAALEAGHMEPLLPELEALLHSLLAGRAGIGELELVALFARWTALDRTDGARLRDYFLTARAGEAFFVEVGVTKPKSLSKNDLGTAGTSLSVVLNIAVLAKIVVVLTAIHLI